MTDETTISASREQVSCQLDGEAVILNLKNSTYYELNPVAARIWDLMQEPIMVGKLRNEVLKEYDVTPERVDHDLRNLIDELSRHQLLVIHEGTYADQTTAAV